MGTDACSCDRDGTCLGLGSLVRDDRGAVWMVRYQDLHVGHHGSDHNTGAFVLHSAPEGTFHHERALEAWPQLITLDATDSHWRYWEVVRRQPTAPRGAGS